MKIPAGACYILVFVLDSSAARAADDYVDAIDGDNANSGLAPDGAWQTISHAVASLPTGAQTVHIAAGLHNEAVGETFPVSVRERVSLVGEDGSAESWTAAGPPPSSG